VGDVAIITIVIAFGAVCVSLAGGLIYFARVSNDAVRGKAASDIATVNASNETKTANASIASMDIALKAAQQRADVLEKKVADANVIAPADGLDELRKLATPTGADVPAASGTGDAGH
jgi:hypothetical protein